MANPLSIEHVLIPIISTDLWVGGDVPGAKSSGKTAKIHYAVGSAEGPIQFAKLGFLGFNVSDQAFSGSPQCHPDRPRLTDYRIFK